MAQSLSRRIIHAGVILFLCLPTTLSAQGNNLPEDFRVALGMAERNFNQQAARHFKNFIQANPGHRLLAEAWYRLGCCQLDLKEKNTALRSFNQALNRGGPFPLRAECRYRLGTALRELGKHEPAQVQFDRLLAEEGRKHYLAPASYFASGMCLRDLGKDNLALKAFQGAAETDTDPQGPYAFPALYQVGYLLMRGKEFLPAEQVFALAAQKYPKHQARGECRFLEGEAAFQGGRIGLAENAYLLASKAGGDFADDALLGLAWCKQESKDPAGALAYFRRLTKDYPASSLVPRARLEGARILQGQGRNQEAVGEINVLLSRKKVPPSILQEAQEVQGLALLGLGRPADAVKRFRAALVGKPGKDQTYRIHYYIGESLSRMGKWEPALAAYLQVVPAAKPGLRGDALYGACSALHNQKKFAASLARALTVVELKPVHRLAEEARFAAGENLFALKRYKEAAAQFAKIPKTHALARKALNKGAWCAYLLGDFKVAARAFLALTAGQATGDTLGEESLAMAALACLEADDLKQALALADRYRVRYPKGSFLARTERVASRVLEKRGDLRGAADRLTRAAKVEVSGDQVAKDQLVRGELHFQAGDYKRAAQEYTSLSNRRDQLGARALEGLAWCAFELGEEKSCKKWIDASLRHPAGKEGQPRILELLSTLHHRAKRWADASLAAKRFLASFPRHRKATTMRFALALAQSRGGQLKAAIATLDALAKMKSYPRPDRVQYELAWALRRSGNEKGALGAFKKVAELSPDKDLAGEAHLHIGESLMGQKKTSRARTRLHMVQGKYRGQALYKIGFSWLSTEQFDRARPIFAKIVALGAGHQLYGEALFLVGECHFRREEYKAAASSFHALLRLSSDHPRAQAARLRLGRCALAQNKSGDAVNLLEDFLHRGVKAADLEKARACLWLGRARLQRNENKKAEKAFKRVARLSTGELAAEAQFRLGESRQERGDLEGAVDAFVKLPILYASPKWVPAGLLAAGRCFEKLDQSPKSRNLYQEVIKRFPSTAAAREARSRLRKVKGV